MANVLCKDKRLDVLHLLLDGASVRSVSRFTGVHRDTCVRLVLRFGRACERFIRREMKDLELTHLQSDEMWTFVRKKQKRILDTDKDADEIGDIYLYRALDEETRLIPAHLVGKRYEANTIEFMTRLADCLRFPKAHRSDDHHYKKGEYVAITRISTDAFPAYRNAVDLAFGPYAIYGQLKKEITADKKVEITKTLISKDMDPETVTTSLVERSNLTSRVFMRRLVRRTLSFSKKIAFLEAAVSMHMAFYNYCWRHGTLKTSPAVAAGIVGKRWTLPQLYEAVWWA